MVKKKVDPRVRGLIEHGVRKNHRSLFLLVGDHGKDQVENIHKILSRTRVKARPSVLWCYKKELGFSTHRKKRMKEIKRNQARGLHDPERDDPFDLFISSTNIRWTYYKETDKILGQTFGMCVLQDFEALTPNLLARTIETVEGGGIVILLLKTVKSLKQLYTLSMDVHSRFRTEAHDEVIPRFNERFILSLGNCQGCLVLDDELNILPISSTIDNLPIYDGSQEGLNEGDADASGFKIDPELNELRLSLTDTPIAGPLVDLTKTVDQANAVMSFLDAISEKTLRSTVSLTAARGRGKSASLGLCLAGAVAQGYANIFVTAPSPENLKTVFEFVILGLNALKYSEHLDYEILQEYQGEMGKVVTRINIFQSHRQTIQYILPTDSMKVAQAELVVIDEAAAIPLPTVKCLMGPYLVFMSSTINGYEGTGRSLSLKLIQQLRTQQGLANAAAANQAGSNVSGSGNKQKNSGKGGRQLHEERWKTAAETANATRFSGTRVLTELSLNVPIRYSPQDPVEQWLNQLLCFDSVETNHRLVHIMPAPSDCDLFIVNRDALFSYHSLSESLLQRIWALYTAAHYKNTPNDLQMLSDAPAHRLFVLLGPQKAKTAESKSDKKPNLPDVLCVIQVAFEGRISPKNVLSGLNRGNKASGDLIPWTISQQFNDNEFASLSGVRIVRIATHPDVQKMGYGARAMELLTQYFQGQLTATIVSQGVGGEGAPEDKETKMSTDLSADGNLLEEEVKPKAKLPPLLTRVTERPAEQVHWMGVSFGLTSQLINFWGKQGFKVCYVRQTKNQLTGEHSAIVLKELDHSTSIHEVEAPSLGWLASFVQDYRRRIISLMGYSFNKLEIPLSIALLDPERCLTSVSGQTAGEGGEEVYLEKEGEEELNGGFLTSLEGLKSMAEGVQQLAKPLGAVELLSVHLTHHDLKRLELYSRNMVDHHMILDLVPLLTKLLFNQRLGSLRFSFLQIAVILAIGLQLRDVDSIAEELNLPSSQILAFFNKTMRKICSYLQKLVENHTENNLKSSKEIILEQEKKAKNMTSVMKSLKEDQEKDAKEINLMLKEKQKKLSALNNDEEKIGIISIPRDENKKKSENEGEIDKSNKKKKRNSEIVGTPISGNKKQKKMKSG